MTNSGNLELQMRIAFDLEVVFIVRNIMCFYGLGLYSKRNTFLWKMIIGKN